MCCPTQTTFIPLPVITTNPIMDTTTTSSPPNNTLSLSALVHQSEPRHVHFQERITIIPSSPPPSSDSSSNSNNDSEPDTYSTWYQWNELDAFRNDARELCREMRYRDTLVSYTVDSNSNNSSDSDSSSSTTARLPTMARSSLTRGLEQRSCDERQRRKYLANRFVLKIAPKLYRTDPEKLAEVSQKCNAWATELAKEEAARDYARVYHHAAAKGDKKRSTLDCHNSATKRIRIQ